MYLYMCVYIQSISIINIASFPYARRQRPIKCHPHGGIPFVVIRVFWLEPINMAVKCTVKCAPIRICALSLMWAPVPVTIWPSRICRCKLSSSLSYKFRVIPLSLPLRPPLPPLPHKHHTAMGPKIVFI